jgi:hypothetical protein
MGLCTCWWYDVGGVVPPTPDCALGCPHSSRRKSALLHSTDAGTSLLNKEGGSPASPAIGICGPQDEGQRLSWTNG